MGASEKLVVTRGSVSDLQDAQNKSNKTFELMTLEKTEIGKVTLYPLTLTIHSDMMLVYGHCSANVTSTCCLVLHLSYFFLLSEITDSQFGLTMMMMV